MAIKTSQNGYPVLSPDSPKLHNWVIPSKTGRFEIVLRNGSAGFILAHYILWFSEVIEPVFGKVRDWWGYAVRPIRGQTTGYSNHASGTAFDLNAPQHPLGKRGTFKPWQYTKMRARLLMYAGAIRLGIDYKNRPDEMHGEINRPLAYCERIAKALLKTPRGKRLIKANPGQRAVIYS